MILISAGHYPGAKGATHEGFSEYPETLLWAVEIQKALDDMRVPAKIVPSGTLREKVNWINREAKIHKDCIAVEIHFNSSPGGRGKGSETLYCPGSNKGWAIAELVQGSIASILFPNRGVKEGWYQMDRPGIVDYWGDVDGDEKPDFFLRATHCPAIIVEPEFIQRRNVIEALRTTACTILAEALRDSIAFL